MACGTPVVTTRYGTEDYARHEENSLVVMPRDIKAMAEAILRLLSDADLREKFRETGPQTAKRFTWEKTVDEFERLFQMALEGRKLSFGSAENHLTQLTPKDPVKTFR
jgi:glycosyltransferase involved in cell wall biosynthesis